MSITLSQTIHSLMVTSTGGNYNRAIKECTYVTILTGVEKTTKPQQDFSLSGTVVYNGSIAQLMESQRNKLLSSFENYKQSDVRFVFSNQLIKDFKTPSSIFLTKLVARVSAVDDTNNYMTIDILRNAYGVQQFQNYLKVV